jgi:hypothetical protein
VWQENRSRKSAVEKCGRKIVVEKVRKENRSRKSAVEKKWQKKCGRKTVAEKVRQENRGSRTLQEEKCMVFICVMLNL